MFDLCNSELKTRLDKDLGVPNEGIHSYRIFNIAYMDVLGTIIGSILLAYIMQWSYIKTIVGMFILGIILHKIFCVRTTVDKTLFP
jgi:hypothetical protein